MRYGLAAVCLAGLAAMTFATTGGTEPTADEQTLRAAGISCDAADLLEFFRERARPKSDSDELVALARKLGSSSGAAHAKSQLIGRGAVAIPALRHVVHDLDDPVAADEAQRCLEWLEGNRHSEVPIAAARLLAARHPPGASYALLTYLPFADDQTVFEAVQTSLVALAKTAAKPDPDLIKGLHDPLPLRRAVAAEVLCSVGLLEALPDVRKLLADPKPLVRFRAAMALLERQDEEAVSVLIDLLADLPVAQRRLAEEALQQLAGEWAPTPNLNRDDEVSRKIRRDVWTAWWRNTDGPSLLAVFAKRTLTDDDHAKAQLLIDKLGDSAFTIRERAAMDLVALGAKVAPLLREATQSADLERVQRAKDCLKDIAQNADRNALPAAAARLLAMRRPAGATAALLAFVPFANPDDDLMRIEISKALEHLAVAAGKPDPAVLAALNDSMPSRRSAAAEAIAGANVREQFPAIRKLLRDPEPSVRLRVAVALTVARDKEGVPVLIDLLWELPPEQSWEAEDLLYRIAGDKAPQPAMEQSANGRKKTRDKWSAWWKNNAESVDLSRLESGTAQLGLTLVAEFSQNQLNGRVIEVGRDGKPRWQIENLGNPVDAWFLPGNRVLIAEWNPSRVTERDTKGNILWQADKLPPNSFPVNVQRLPSGNTFIANQNNGLLEFDRTGKVVFSVLLPQIRAAKKLANGQMVCLTQQGQCVRLDATGKEIKRFALINAGTWTSGIEVTLQGHILVGQNNNMIAAHDLDGKLVWQMKADLPTSATRLANGHTLVASHQAQTVVELDSTGHVVWEYRAPAGYHPFRARRR